jgi:hypothetical protein
VRDVKKGIDCSLTRLKEAHMTLCPIAIAVGCQKCFAFRVCPAKGIIGDYKKDPANQAPGNKEGNASKTKEKM